MVHLISISSFLKESGLGLTFFGAAFIISENPCILEVVFANLTLGLGGGVIDFVGILGETVHCDPLFVIFISLEKKEDLSTSFVVLSNVHSIPFLTPEFKSKT